MQTRFEEAEGEASVMQIRQESHFAPVETSRRNKPNTSVLKETGEREKKKEA